MTSPRRTQNPSCGPKSNQRRNKRPTPQPDPVKPWPARHAWSLALVAALVAACGIWFISDQAARNDDSRPYGKEQAMPEPGELLREVIAKKDQRVVVAQDVTLPVDEADLAEARRILESAGTEVYLFMIPEALGSKLYTTYGAAEVLAANVLGDRPGWVVTYFTDGNTVVIETGGAPYHSLHDTDGQPGPTLVRIATEMADWTLEERR